MKTYVNDLRESNEFLNLLLDNINSAVLIADENLRIHQFNDSFLNLFDRAAEGFMEKAFGEASGCVNAVQENKPCGETSQCAHCILRRSLIQTLVENAPVERQFMERTFYINGKPAKKYLEFTARKITFQGRKMHLVIIYDVTNIERQKIELQEKQKQLDQDLRSAAAIQQSLLPDRSPNIKDIRIAWRFEPCEQIGGDIFNIQKLDESNIGVYMLDVCGHGVPAALIAVAASQFLFSGQGLLGNDCQLMSPETVLINLDHAFPFERFDSYFSIICLTIDVSQGLLTYSCGGHPPPIVLGADGVMEVLDRRGPIIGAGCGECFGQAQRKLQPGDKIILYTDGIFDTRNTAGEDFGKQRFYEALQRHRHAEIRELVEAVYATAKEFRRGAKPDDDISLLGIEYKARNCSKGMHPTPAFSPLPKEVV